MAIKLTYSSTTFVEAGANDGSITATSTIMLAGDTFKGDVGAALGTVSKVPDGLTAVLVKATDTTATLSFSGQATAHAHAQDISNLTVSFTAADFNTAVMTGASGLVTNNLKIDFADSAATGPLTIAALENALGKAWPALKGTATSKDADVHVFNGTKDLGKATVDADGNWTFTVPASVKDGKASFTVKEFADKKFGAASTAVEYTLDSKAPAAPTVNAIKLPTKDTTPELSGKAEKDAMVEVFADGVSVGSVKASSAGVWKLDTSALAEKVHAITAKATDAAGNVSAASKAVNLTVDTSIAQPTITTDIAPSSKVATQKLEGKAEAGAKVQIYGGADGTTALGKPVVADKNGVWKASVKLEDVAHKLTVKATDVAGNESVASAEKAVTIDTKAPGLPTVAAPGTTPAKTLPTTLTGKAEAGAKVDVYAGSIKLGTATADDSGTWSLTPVLAKPLKDGVQKITAKAIDAAGNVSKASAAQSFTIDNKAPAAPTVDAIKLPTKDTTPTLTGKAEKGASVEVFESTNSLGKAIADAKTGVWTLTVKDADKLADAAYNITAQATDAAGNVGIATTRPATLVIDTVSTTPTITTTLPPSSKITTQTLTGTAEAGAKVQIYGGTDGKTPLLTTPVTANSSGVWTASVKLTEALHTISVVATDVAGNLSDNSDVKTIDIDTTAPLGPVLNDPGSLLGQALPDQFSGTGAEPKAKVAVYANTTKLGEVTADASGAWTFLTSEYKGTPLTDGVKSIVARTIDPAGNLSAASNAVQFTIDTTGPTLNTAATSADGSQVVLTYNEALGATVAAANAFSVEAGGANNPVTAVAVNDKTITLTLTSSVVGGTVVTVAYTAPADNQATTNAAIQDQIGNDAATFAARAVTNTLPDVTPPVISDFHVAGATTLSVTSTEAGRAGLYTVDAALPGLTATLAAGAPGTLTVAAQSTVTTVTLHALDAASNSAVHSANPVVLGTAGADTIEITSGSNFIFSFGGADIMVFKSLTVGTIADYTVADDSIQLSKAVFTALGAEGALGSDFLSVATATDLIGGFSTASTARAIIYFQDTGALYYNADGATVGGLTLIGTFTNKPELDAAEFTVIL